MCCQLQSHVNKLILGGEFCLWTDMWARNYQCFDQPKEQWMANRYAPVAHWMSDRSKDSVFMDSAAGMVSSVADAQVCTHVLKLTPFSASFLFKLWPRGIAAAGNFWNPAPDVPSKDIQSAVKYQLQVRQLMTGTCAIACNL